MKQWRKRGIVLVAAFSLAVASLAGCGATDPEETVLTVGEEQVPFGVVNYFSRMQQARYESYYAAMMGMTGEAFWEQDTTGADSKKQSYEEMVKEGVMGDMQQLYLIRQHAEEYGVTLSEEEETAIEEAAKQFVSDNAQEARDVVSGEEKYVKEYLTLMAIENKMAPKMMEGVDEDVSDEEAAQKAMEYIYVAYSKQDESGNSVDLSDEEKESLKEDVKKAMDDVKAEKATFAEAAEELGVSVQTATFDKDSYAPNADLVKAADALEKEGDYTDLVEIDRGIYVGHLTSLLDREATDTKKASVVEQRKNEQFSDLVDTWKEETEITVNEGLWKKVSFTKQGVTIKDTATSTE